MRVLWNNHRDIRNPTSGGAERTIHEVGRRLAARGHSVVLTAIRWPGSLRKEYVEGVEVLRFRTNPLLHAMLPIVVSNSMPDVIVDDLAHAVPWFSPWITSVPGTAFFRHSHARTLPGQIRSALLVRLLTYGERMYPRIYRSWPFVTESQASVADLGGLGIGPARCVRIPPGVDPTRFRPGAKTEQPTILYAAGFRSYKRPEHAVLVQNRLMNRGIRSQLRMVGDGPALPAIRRLVQSLHLEGAIQILGRVGDTEFAKLASESWVNLHCSVAEGWGLTIMETASAGTPTVAYNVPGVSETVRDRETGMLCMDGDLEALTDATAELLSTPEPWGRRAREWALRFSWDETASAWEEHLQSLADGRYAL